MERFASLLKEKQIIVLGILDRFPYMDPDLITILKSRVPRYVPL